MSPTLVKNQQVLQNMCLLGAMATIMIVYNPTCEELMMAELAAHGDSHAHASVDSFVQLFLQTQMLSLLPLLFIPYSNSP